MIHKFQCSRCRQSKEIVKYIKGMKYCQACQDKAPTREQYRNYILENSRITYVSKIKDVGNYKSRE